MEETKLRIRVFGDTALRKKTKPVDKIQPYHRQILSQMAKLMYASSGIGLAAPQVGLEESLIVLDAGTGLYKLINPRIIKREGRQAIEEGCLSVPGICIKVRRAKRIVVEAEDENAKPVIVAADDLLACVFQHEIDHLSGRLIIDHASIFEKLKMRNRLEEIRREVEYGELPESKTKSCRMQL